jgi:hypothetical protein
LGFGWQKYRRRNIWSRERRRVGEIVSLCGVECVTELLKGIFAAIRSIEQLGVFLGFHGG